MPAEAAKTLKFHMRVSVVIPTFNRLPQLRRAVQSVIQQIFTDWELIIVDDGSTDGSAEWLKSLQLEWSLPQPIVVKTIVNSGVSRARNVGAHLARGEWLAFLDSDDEWHDDRLMEQWPLTLDFSLIHSNEVWLRNGQEVRQLKKHKKAGGRIFTACVENCCISPSTVLMHRRVFDRVGGFSESLPVCEDYAMWLQVAATETIGFIEAALVTKHAGHPGQLSFDYHSMDLYRIQALLPLLEHTALSPLEKQLVAESILRRLEILRKGQKRHGSHIENLEIYERRALSCLTTNHRAHSTAER